MATLRRQRDETLAFLSHDLRSPAAAILALVPDSDRVAGHARRLLRLADQFVQGLRAEQAPLAIEPVELAALLDEAADHCWEAAQRVGGQVTVTASWDIPDIATDRALMARAVVNLIDNALKYGGERPQVHVRGWFRAGQAVVSVADTGPGMAVGQVASLFNRFERAGAVRPDGVGLGLALVATFARRQEGNVECISRPGVGTVCVMTVPVL
jgi:signal transduction histidine kinase